MTPRRAGGALACAAVLSLSLHAQGVPPSAPPAAAPPAQAPDDHAALGAALNKQGIEAYSASRIPDAERLWMASLAEFTLAGNGVERANILRNLTLLPHLSIEDRVALLDEALSLATAAAVDRTQGLILGQIADFDFIRGDYA